MPEVGVLELQIRDDSKEAGRGLGTLAGALERVKGAVEGFSLSAVRREVSGLSSEITSQKGASTTVKNLASLFNAISKFSKIKNFTIDTKPFESLKAAIGDGFKLGTAGTQLNQLREAISGDWGDGRGIASLKSVHDVINDFATSGDAKKIKDLTVAVKEYGEAMKQIKEKSSSAGDWRSAMSGGAIENIANQTTQWQKLKVNLSQFGEKTKREMQAEQMKMDLDNIVSPAKEGFQEVNSTIHKGTAAAQEYKETLEETTKSVGEGAKDAVIKDVASSVEFLTERWKNAANGVGTYGDKITEAVLPKMNAISAEEMVIKKNGEMATAVIERLITRLNAVDKNANKGYGNLFNIMAGVSRGNQSTSSAQDSAKTIQENWQQIVEVEKALDRVKDLQNTINTEAEKSKPVINMENIPASGQNGPFANVAEEVADLQSKLDSAKQSLSQWESVYERIQKDIKYKGETQERTNMLGHAEEGFYSSLEDIKKYEDALRQIQDYINNYSRTMQNATEAMEKQNGVVNASNSVTVYKSIEEAAKAMGISVEEATRRMQELYNMTYSGGQTTPVFSSLEEAANSMGITLDEAKQKVVGFNDAIGETTNAENKVNDLSGSVQNLFEQSQGQESIIPTDVFLETYSHIDYLKSKLQDLKNDLEMRRKLGLLDEDAIDQAVMKIRKLQDEIKELEKKSSDATNAAKELSFSWKGFGHAVTQIFPGLTGLIKRFAQIAKYRMLRSVLKHITSGFKEGLENVYKYSQAIGSSLAPAMDSATSAFAQFKNSIGAAIAPVLQALIPILNQITNAAISVINTLNQLFALLGGKNTWTKALPATKKAFEDTKKSAGGANNAIKEMLASFDELNVIASEGGSGGGGGAASALEDYENMFTEMYAFDEKIRDFVEWLNENMESIKGIAIAIGTAILGWKLSNAFAEVLPLLSKIFGFVATGAVIAITVQFTWMLTNQYLDTKEIGWLFADMLTTAIGATAAAAIAKKLIGGQAAVYTAAITLTLSAATGIIALIKDVDTSAFSKESLLVALENALKMGGAAGILMKSVGGATLGTSLLGGAVVAITTFAVAVGLKTALDPNVKLFSTLSIITAIITTGITALGLAFISGSWAIAAGGALLYLAAYVGLKVNTSSSKIEWGDIHLTERQVEAFVEKKMFRIDVNASIERINTTIEATALNRTELQNELTGLLGDMNLIKLGIADVDDYTEMQNKVNSIVDKAHKFAESEENLAKLTLQFTPSLVGNNEEEQADWFTSYTKGWEKVDKWFADKGKELGELFVTNEKGEIIASKPELIQEILNQISEVTAAANKFQIEHEAYTDLLIGIGDLDEASATDVINKYKEYMTNLRTALENQAKTQLEGQRSLVAMLFEIDPSSPEYYAALAELERMTNNLVSGVEEDFENAIGPGRNLIMEWIFGNHAKGSINMTWTDDLLQQYLSDGLTDTINLLLKSGGVSGVEIDAMNLINFTGWDLLAEDLQKKIVQYSSLDPRMMQALKDELQIDASTVLKFSGWEKFEQNEKVAFINSMAKVYGTDAIKKIKNEIKDIKIQDLISVSGWESWTKEEQKDYLKALEEAYGSYVVTNGLMSLGENVPKWIAEGIEKRQDLTKALYDIEEDLRDAGINVQDIISDWDLTAPIIEDKSIEDSVEIIKNIINICGKDSKEIIRNWNLIAPEVSQLTLRTSYDAITSLSKQTGIDVSNILANWHLIAPFIDQDNVNYSVNKIGETIKNNKNDWQTTLDKELQLKQLSVPDTWGDRVKRAAKDLADGIEYSIDRINPSIDVETAVTATVNAKVNITTNKGSVYSSIVTAAESTINYWTNAFRSLGGWVFPTYASGAYGIPNGEIFVANENGPELVGKIGGKNTVANQGQIVEGIAMGVAASNAEQNALLREQNNLLRKLLEKDSSVRIGASAAFGRVAKQSLEMYGNLAGG